MILSHNRVEYLARKAAHEESPTTYRLGRILFRRDALPAYCLAYSYLRWLDDSIDSAHMPQQAMQSVLARQRDLISMIYQDPDRVEKLELDLHEQMLVLLIRYDQANGVRLREHILAMLQALDFDAHRRYQPCSEAVLDSYSLRLGRAYINLMLAFTLPHGDLHDLRGELQYAGFAAHQTHLLRDFYEDLDLGFFNIDQETLSSHGWSLEHIAHIDLRPWVLKTMGKAYAAFDKGLRALDDLDNVRCRLLGYAISAQYVFILAKIADLDYSLREPFLLSTREKGKMLGWAARATLSPGSALRDIEQGSWAVSQHSL